MDENFNKDSQEASHMTEKSPIDNIDKTRLDNAEIKHFSMETNGKLRTDINGEVAVQKNSRTFIILGWVSAALALIWPIFAIAGITFGLIANKRMRSTGNAVIISNIVIAAIYFIFRLVLMASWGGMMIR